MGTELTGVTASRCSTLRIWAYSLGLVRDRLRVRGGADGGEGVGQGHSMSHTWKWGRGRGTACHTC